MLTLQEFKDSINKIDNDLIINDNIKHNQYEIKYYNHLVASINSKSSDLFAISSYNLPKQFNQSAKFDELFVIVKEFANTPIRKRNEKKYIIELRAFKDLNLKERFLVLQLNNTSKHKKNELYFDKFSGVESNSLHKQFVFTESELNDLKFNYSDWFAHLGKELVFTEFN